MNNYNQQGPLGENVGWITKMVSIEDLRSHPTFVDWHMLDQLKVDEQAEQFAKFGQHACGAILVDPLNRVLDGYHAWAALRKEQVTGVWVTVVDLPDDQLEELVALRHKNRHHYTDKHLMHWIMTKYVGFARGQKPNGKPFPSALPSETGAELNQDPRKTHEQIAAMFHSNTTTVKQAISLKRSGDRYLISEVLIGSKTINGAHKVANPPDTGNSKGLGWKPKRPIPIGDAEIAAFTKEAAEAGLSVEAMLAECIKASIPHLELPIQPSALPKTSVPGESVKQTFHRRAGEQIHSAAVAAEAPNSPPTLAIKAHQPSNDQPADTTDVSTNQPSTPDSVDSATSPVATSTSAPVAPQKSGDASIPLKNEGAVSEDGHGRRGIKRWPLRLRIKVLELRRAGGTREFVAEAVGPNSYGNIVTPKSLEHLFAEYGLPNKKILSAADEKLYGEVIDKLKAKLDAGTAS